MHSVPRRFLMLMAAIALLAGCNAATSQPTPTVVPTEPPASTAVPPTSTPPPTNTPAATPLPPTATAVPPTATPIPPTDTPVPIAMATSNPIAITPRNTAAPKPPIGSPNLGEAHRTAGQAANAFAQALDAIQWASSAPSLSPLENAIAQAMRAIEGVKDAATKIMSDESGGRARQIEATDPRCVEAVNSHNAIPAFTLDPSGQPAAVQTAYQLYQEALNKYQSDVSNFPKACAAGDTVSPVGMGPLYKNFVAILDKLKEAQAALK